MSILDIVKPEPSRQLHDEYCEELYRLEEERFRLDDRIKWLRKTIQEMRDARAW